MVAFLKTEVRGLKFLDELEELPARIPIIASRAINQVTRQTRTQSSRILREQINFPARFLSGENGKIAMIPSNPGTLTARLTAGSDPRSLARFAKTAQRVRGRRKGVKVEVKPGAIADLPGAFFLGIGGNTLLAVRSASQPRTAYKPRKIAKGLWSLYGPSVAQALITTRNGGIWPDLEEEILAKLEAEFLRQVNLGNI